MAAVFFRDRDAFFNDISKKIIAEIDAYSDEKIVAVDFDEQVEYFFNKYAVEEVVLDLDRKTLDISEVKCEVNRSYRYEGQSKTVAVDGYGVTCVVPFSGDAKLWNLEPSVRYAPAVYEGASVVAPTLTKQGEFHIRFTFQASELDALEQEKKAWRVESVFTEKYKYFKNGIDDINTIAKSYNSTLRKNIRDRLEYRKNRASSLSSLKKALNIPMTRSPDAPNTIPIPLKRVVKAMSSKPQSKQTTPEYSISDEDYTNIKRIIHSCSTAMEETARTHSKLAEEELRDFLLATLKTHYDSATGESFRKTGKVDIQVVFENKAGYIAECKVWGGKEVLNEALEQLYSYTTWRDTKCSIIIFNKKNKKFLELLETVNKWVVNIGTQTSREQMNKWHCVIANQDTGQQYIVNIAVYNLFFDK